MTIPAFAQDLGCHLPSDFERASANQLRKIIATYANGDATLQMVDNEKAVTKYTYTRSILSFDRIIAAYWPRRCRHGNACPKNAYDPASC